MRPFDWQKLLLLLIIIVLATAGSLWLLQSESNTQIVYLPGRDLPAYHLIQETDLITKTLPVSDLSQDALTDKDELINKYTLEAVSTKQAVTKSQELVNERLSGLTGGLNIPGLFYGK